MSARKGARQLSLAVEDGMLLDFARAPKGRPSMMSPVEFRECFWLEFENDIIYELCIHTDNTPVNMTRSGATEDTSDAVSSDVLMVLYPSLAKSTTRAERKRAVRKTVARFPASDSSASLKNRCALLDGETQRGVTGTAKRMLTSLPQPQHNLFQEHPRSLYEEETGGCL
jgi:hypothetical protein